MIRLPSLTITSWTISCTKCHYGTFTVEFIGPFPDIIGKVYMFRCSVCEQVSEVEGSDFYVAVLSGKVNIRYIVDDC